jgi:RNA 2',3'-cyclic 3'-phosphodiesterase
VAREAPSKARLFVALDLPDDARQAIVAWQQEALGGYGRSLRLVRPEALHVTLVFLGHHPEDEIDEIGGAAFSSLADVSAPVLAPAAVKPIPPRRARLFALDLDDEDGRAAAVQAAVAAPLVRGGWYEPEKRAFWPHITLARVRANERAPRLDVGPPGTGPFDAREVVLYRSKLGRGGAEYRALARMTLR